MGKKLTWEENPRPTTKIINKELHFNTRPITIEELNSYIKKAKRRKAPGPDDIAIELIKELDDESRLELLNEFNKW